MDNTLVSIIVVTYNSSKTVLETLESIKQQTYKNCELIVSDDFSKDSTVEICKMWISDNRDRFVNTKLITIDHNTGVCANLNRGVAESQGYWIKIIAADDILLPNCIHDFVEYAGGHPDAHFITSFQRIYKNTFEEKNLIGERRTGTRDLSLFEKDAECQLKVMAFSIFVNAPTMFFQRILYNQVGGFDERYAYEDHPFYINILENGYKIYLMPKETVCYRVHDSTFNSNSRLFNYEFLKSSRFFRKERCFKYYNKKQIGVLKTRWKIEDMIQYLGLNKRTRIMNLLYSKMVSLSIILAG